MDDYENEADKLLDKGAEAYRNGDYEVAQEYYEQAASLGGDQAACNLGYIYAFGRTGKRDDEKAFYYFSSAALDGNPNGMYKVGDAYYYGDFVKKNLEIAFKCYRNAEFALGENDDDLRADVYYRLARSFYYGEGVESDLMLALSYINTANTFSYYDLMNHKFGWEALAEKIDHLREEIVSKFQPTILGKE